MSLERRWEDFDWNVEHWDEVPDREKNDRLPRGVTVSMFRDAVKDNEGRVRNLLGSYDSWTGDVMCDLAFQAMRALPRWASYEHRSRLAAFVNSLAKSVVNEWLDRERPKHRGGMTYSPKRDRRSVDMPDDPGDADQVRAWLRDAGQYDQADRFDTGEDINSQYGPDERLHAAPTDRLDYENWKDEQRGGEHDDDDSSNRLTLEWDREYKALRNQIGVKYRSPYAWDAVVRLADKDYRPDSDSGLIRNELLKWVLDCRSSGGRLPDLDGFPIITRTCQRAVERRNRRQRRAGR